MSFVKTAGGNPPTVEFIREFDEEQFKNNLEKALREIDRKKRESKDHSFWEDEQPTEICNDGQQKEDDSYASLILRPIINRGMSTLIVGEPFAGKSAFSIAMGGYLCGGSDNHFLENWYWTRHDKKPQDEKAEKIEKAEYKVVYLLFDSGGNQMLNKYRKDFCPGIEKDHPLLKLEDLGGNTTDYSLEENFGKFLKLIENYEKDRPIDVLFIDSVARFTDNDHGDFGKLNKFMVAFNARRPDVALVFLHHTKSKESEAYGGTVAYRTVRNCCVLYRTKEQKKAVKGTPTLNDPFTIRVKKTLLSSNIPTDLEDFTARTVNNEFTAVASDLEQAKRLHEIVDAYTAEDLKRPEIASLLDCSTKTLFNHLKSSNNIIAKANTKQKAAQNIEEDL